MQQTWTALQNDGPDHLWLWLIIGQGHRPHPGRARDAGGEDAEHRRARVLPRGLGGGEQQAARCDVRDRDRRA